MRDPAAIRAALDTLERACIGSVEDQRIIERAVEIGPLYPTGVPSLRAITQARSEVLSSGVSGDQP